MKRKYTPLEYPLTIRQVETFLIFSVKDFNISVVEPMPESGKISPEFLRKVMGAVAKAWVKTQERIREFESSGRALPDPSKIRVATRDLKKTKPLTVPQVAKLLAISENSVRRIPKSQLRFRRTAGGHRRYSIGALKAYREQYDTHPEAQDSELEKAQRSVD